MKKLLTLLAVLALVGCEGSGNSNNNNPNPDGQGDGNNGDDNRNENGDVNANGDVVGKWTYGEDVTYEGDIKKITFTISKTSVSQAVACNDNKTYTATVNAKVTENQIELLASQSKGTQTCPSDLQKGAVIEYRLIDKNNMEIMTPNGTFALIRVR